METGSLESFVVFEFIFREALDNFQFLIGFQSLDVWLRRVRATDPSNDTA